ncbi:MAG: lecithin retinol acyltransferase family protein [Bacteroidia bacterium]|nr:lecithin retinol acyltransferase family protein [Bacteroidia bacterium]
MASFYLLNQFVRQNDLRPADVIVVKKAPLGLLSHYVVFLGHDSYGQPVFMASLNLGIKILTPDLLQKFQAYLNPVRIRRFQGTERQREQAVGRALQRRDESSYNLLVNNCEHFANYVQKGQAFSQQSQVAGLALVLALFAILFSPQEEEENY